MENKDRFLKVFSNLQIDVRKEIVVVIDNQPISWDVAFAEINKETNLGKNILEKLVKMEVV